ncbi:O-methyltransferase [Domibacillus epiphyticus]|uniref:tRNA 5-hydroxyuridine methyltransferase n=1 Tax=Domibacillus epiphyticus TaxID=1714355 RepID=A0A1V2A9D1_9BACI|nr:O-methyltransferase [Domibacillus epiphyticus]OMP67601.1 SAM-dependent methyltransferase [Domibacillus epiphyticus]
MKDDIHRYIESLLPARNELFAEMEQYAMEYQVPIMEPVGMETLLTMLKLQKPVRILEIGTAIGYSALRIADAVPGVQIITMERDVERHAQAIHYIERSNYTDRVRVLLGDALELAEEAEKNGPYDAIFIDAAKGQYKRFFDLYAPMLTDDGVVYSDNVLFKGYAAGIEAPSKRIEKMVKKITDYNEWLMAHDHFQTIILPSGDGIAVSLKRSEEK